MKETMRYRVGLHFAVTCVWVVGLLFSSAVSAAPAGTAWLAATGTTNASANINTASPTSLLWTQADLDSGTFTNTDEELTVLAFGDYWVAVTVPMELSDPATADIRTAVLVQLYVNDVPVPHAIGESSYIRNENDHTESSAHVSALLAGLSSNDVITAKVQQRTDKTDEVVISGRALLYAERIDPLRTVFAARGTRSVLGPDLNQSVSPLQWSASDRVDAGYGHDVNSDAHEITLSDGGDYLVSVTVPLESTVARANVKLRVLTNGVGVAGGQAKQGYIRGDDQWASENHHNASLHWVGLVPDVAGDTTLTITVEQEAEAGTVTVGSFEASVMIEKIDTSTEIFSARGTTLEGGTTEWNPVDGKYIHWDDVIVTDTVLFTHDAGTDSHKITLLADGDVLLLYNDSLAITTEEIRVNPLITVHTNGVAVAGAQTKSHYIRGLSGHQESSGSLVMMLPGLKAGDVISVYVDREANAGAVIADDAALLTLWIKGDVEVDTSLAVAALSPTDIASTSATLNGVVLQTGEAENPEVYVLWSDSEQGTGSTSAWNVISLGADWGAGESFSTNLTGLESGSNYTYRCYVTNTTGEAWSEAQTFTTIFLPTVTEDGAVNVGRQVATLQGEVTDDGGETPLAGFEWWEVGGAVTTVVNKSYQDGVFSESLSGLTEATEYAYRAWASNAVGQVWSAETHTWTTLSADPLAFYVTPSGAGTMDGSDWDNAFGLADLQDALAVATVAGDEIRMRHGVYTNTAQLAVIDHPNLTIRGGYEGNGAPGGFSSEATVLTRDPAVRMRIFYGNNSVLTLDRLTFAGGYANASDGPQNGIGLAFDGCTTVITNSVIRDNRRDGYLLNCHGGGVSANNGSLTVVDSFIDNNQVGPGSSNLHGGGLHANNVNLTLIRTHITRNRIGGNSGHYGGGIHLNGGNALIDDCMFGTNYVAQLPSGWTYNNRGGAIYANNVSPFTITNTHFYGNYVAGNATSGDNFGGALDIRGSNPLAIKDCVFTGNRLVAGNTRKGGVMHLSGVAGTVADTFIAGAGTTAGAPELLYVATTGANNLTISNTVVHGKLGAGIRKAGTGSATLNNCLVFNADDHGLAVSAGTANVRHTTLAGNAGWGIHHDGGVLTVSDTIAWDNTGGGISTPDGTVNYTLSQEAHGGTANLTDNPLFIAGYYLSRAGLPGQSQTSPAVGAGSMTAGAAGLTNRTTRTDGATPDAGDTVDLGYHDEEGFDGDLEKLLNLYVDVATGNDEDDGTAEEPLKTITEALSRAISGSTIHVATGVYNTASGEVFPLETQHPGLTMIGQGPGLTVLDAQETDRVFQATGGGAIWLEGLTFKNGYVASSPYAGAGLYLPSCQTVITNCWITNNRIVASANRNGQGIVAYGGSLTIVDSRIANNGNPSSSGSNPQGGGLYAFDAQVQLIRVDVVSNIHRPNAPSRGVGVYLNGGSALIFDSLFDNNRMTMGHQHEGGGLYATGVSPLTISNCVFRGNYLAGADANQKEGAGLWVQNSAEFTLVDSKFEGNYTTGGATRRGSALYIGSTVNGMVSDCTVIGGNAGNGLEQVWINAGSHLAIQNMHVQPGTVTTGSGIRMQGSGTLALTNVLVHGFAGDGIQMANAGGTLDVVNATLADNTGWGVSKAAGTVSIINSIAWNNTAGCFESPDAISYSSGQILHVGDGNIVGDPLFEEETGDYRLQRASDCVDAGSNAPWDGVVDAVDLDGEPRIRNGRVDRPLLIDMGAYELPAPRGSMIMVR